MTQKTPKISQAQINYMEQHGLNEPPTCPVCGKPCSWDTSTYKCFKTFCCNECRRSSQGQAIIQQKMKQTSLEKYGTINAGASEKAKQKRKQTNLERYGVEHSNNVEKAKKTSQERYGCDNAMQNPDIHKKAEETNIEKYGSKNPTQNEEVKQKTKETCLEKYGAENFLSSKQGKRKNKQSYRQWYYYILVERLAMKNIIPLFDKETFVENTTSNYTFEYRCVTCNSIIETNNTNSQTIRCKQCNPHISIVEKKLRQWIDEIYHGDVQCNKFFSFNDKRFEIDIFLPEFNIGIEFHGNYWHCDLYKHNDYHQHKYLYFKQQNIQLIQVFESEWVNNPYIVKSIIKSKLKLNETIYARKCIVKEIDNTTYNIFCEQNHLQGSCVAKIRIGLFFDNNLVQCISFAKPRFNKNYEYELIRSCSKLNTTIVGGFNKLFKHFTKTYQPRSIITYCDARYFNGVGYQQAGFEFVELTKPDFFYFHKSDCCDIYHRTHFQKHKLSDILPQFDCNKTAELNMLENGYSRIFDAGNLKFQWLSTNTNLTRDI